MRKTLVFLFCLPLLGILAQVPVCGYDHTFIASGKKGIWPDSATNFVSGTVGTPYSQNITIVVPKDTTATVFSQTQTFTISTIDLQTNITSPPNYGLPPGLQITGTPSNYKFPGNDSSCMVIYGTPTTAGTYTLSFTLKAYVTAFPNVAVKTVTIIYYKITISPMNGIATWNESSFRLGQSSPNPVTEQAQINFTALVEGRAEFCLFDVTGKKIAVRELKTQKGDNTFEFDASQLENGIYLYSIEMNQQKQCRRLVVAR